MDITPQAVVIPKDTSDLEDRASTAFPEDAGLLRVHHHREGQAGAGRA